MGLGTAHEVKHHWGFGCPVYGAAVLFEPLILHAQTYICCRIVRQQRCPQ